MSALDIQIGGEHYKDAKIQPIQYIEANGLGFLEGCVVKRITRHDKPTGKGRQDIEKAIHELQLLLEFRYKQVSSTEAPAVYQDGETIVVHTPEQADAVRMVFDARPNVHTMTNPPGEDIYAELAARVGTAPGCELLIKCEECKTVSRGGRLHVCTCSRLTAPEEYKAEAQIAFDEAAELSDALARQVSAGKIDTDFDESTLEDEYSAYAEPAAAMDDDSQHMQAIGQNGEMAEEVYAAVDAADPFAGAPDWAKYKAQDADGEWYWYQNQPKTSEHARAWMRQGLAVRRCGDGYPNPNWRDTLIART